MPRRCRTFPRPRLLGGAVLAAALTVTACGPAPSQPSATPAASRAAAPSLTASAIGASPPGSSGTPPVDITARELGQVRAVTQPGSLAVAVDFVGARHGWAVGDCDTAPGGGGCAILATANGGRTWSIQRTGLAANGYATFLQFLNSSDGFVVDTEASCTRDCPTDILATTDGGQTWHVRLQAAAGTAPPFHAFDFVTRTTGWAIRPAGLAETTDGGKDWATVIAPKGCTLETVRFTDPNNGWLGGGGPNGPCLYATQDGGATWHRSFVDGARPPSPIANAFAAYARGVGMARVLKDPAKLGDGCAVSQVEVHVPAVWLVVDCTPFDPGAFAVLRSTDGGGQWSYVWGSFGCLMGCQGDGESQAPLGFLGAATAWRAAPYGLQRTEDGGATWTSGPGLCADPQCVPALSFISVDNGWAATQQGLFATRDGGLTWQRQLPAGGPGPLRAVHFVSATTGYAVAQLQPDTVILTTDAGRTWTVAGAVSGVPATAPVPGSAGVQGITFLAGGTGWAWRAHALLATADGGRTWHALPPLPTSGPIPVQPQQLDFVNKDDGWLLGFGSPPLHTTDGGRTWTALPPAPTVHDIAFVDPNRGFGTTFAKATRRWTLLSTATAGAAWTPLATWTTSTLIAVSFASAEDGWLLGSDGVLRTTDGGRTWTDISLSHLMALGPRSLQFVSASDGWILTNAGHLLRSTDAGQTWTEVDIGAGGS